MSWLPRSIANSILIDAQDGHDPTTSTSSSSSNHGNNDPSQFLFNGEEEEARRGGVKEDLSEFTESLTRQLWGVASLLAPPPPPPPPPPRRPRSFTNTQPHPSLSGRDSGDVDLSDESRFGGVSAPIDKEEAVIGVTDEALAFARNIAHHPETWLDFPLSEQEQEEEEDHNNNDDFEMSDAQWNHVTLIEHLAPRLAALRIELCPVHMSESYFWKVYFVLLHPRLNRHDADLLSTPQIVAARGMWMKELQKRNKPEADLFVPTTLDSSSNFQNQDINNNNNNSNSSSGERRRDDYSGDGIGGCTKEVSSSSDDDDWVHENSELDGYDGPDVLVATDEDISFSDLERSP